MPKPFDPDSQLRRVDWREVTHQLSSLLPEDAFFMKDSRGRFIMQNRRAYEYCNVSDEADTLGKRDADFFSSERAAVYEEGDRQVMRSGQPIVDEIAPAPEEAG